MRATIFFFLIVLAASVQLNAQKLPNKQERSVWAPPNPKIDGTLDEWGNQFEAYNHATDLYYTLANDDKTLYLVIRCNDEPCIYNKIMTGGISVVFKSANALQALTFPVFNHKALPSFKRIRSGDVFDNGIMRQKVADSLLQINNSRLQHRAVEVVVTGFSGIDTTVSVYNEYGLRVAGRFDSQSSYTVEFAIPLKYIIKEDNLINYQVILNGGANKYLPELARITGGTHPDGSPMTQAEIERTENAVNAAKMSKYATTDFSGEYTLAKKP